MKTLDKYLGKTVIGAILMVIFVLVALEIFILFSNEFTDMGTGNYGLMQVFVYVLLLLPFNIYQFFPIAGLIGSLIGLGLLASRSELIVMRAAGMSIVKIAWAVIKAALLIMLLAILLGEVIAPVAQHAAAIYKAHAMSSGQALHTRHGTWVRSGSDFIHIDTILSKGRLQNITRYQFNNNGVLSSASFAKDATYKDDKWIFQQVAETIFMPGYIISKHYENQNWNFKFKPHLLGLVNIDTDEKSLLQLNNYIDYLHSSGLATNKYQFAFWQRIFQPLATLVMILLAIPFVFGPLRSATMGLRIVAGTVTGFVFYTINQFIGPLTAVYQLPPLAVASIPILLVAILGIILLLRVR